MKGFDSEFRDLDHYIRVITDRIWEGGRIDDIYRYYSDPCVVETPAGVSTSVQAVVDGTRATLAVFPDRRLLAEDVIQSGDEEGGFLSSHRIISTMTHRGAGDFGPATGRRIHARTVADCVCRDNRIVHEWLVRDQGAIARQIGLAPRALAQTWLDARGGWTKPQAGPAPSGYRSFIDTHSDALAYARAIEDFVRGGSPVSTVYDEAVHQLGPGGATAYGHAEVGSFWKGFFAALRVQDFTVEHLVRNTGSGRTDRCALRWRATAVHADADGAGLFGSATGREVEIMGINHVEWVGGKVLREWVLVDEIALWMQVLQPRT